jgi:hypothetical protein
MSALGQNENPPLAVARLLSPGADITRTNQLQVDWSTGEVIRCPGDVSAGRCAGMAMNNVMQQSHYNSSSEAGGNRLRSLQIP